MGDRGHHRRILRRHLREDRHLAGHSRLRPDVSELAAGVGTGRDRQHAPLAGRDRSDQPASDRQSVPLRRSVARRAARQSVVLVRESQDDRPDHRVPRWSAFPRRGVPRDGAHRRRAHGSRQAGHPRVGGRARQVGLLRVAQQRVHAPQHDAAAPVGRASKRPRAGAGGGDGARLVRAGHSRTHAGWLLHGAARAYV